MSPEERLTIAIEELNVSLAQILKLLQKELYPTIILEQDDPAALSLAKKLAKTRPPGAIIFLTKEESEVFDKRTRYFPHCRFGAPQ